MRSSVEWMERHQVALYLAGLVAGGVVGLLVPAVAGPAEFAIQPVLALLLYATFLGIPFGDVGRALRDRRFLATIGVVNFVVVPPIVWLLSRVVAHDRVLLVGVLFVLLTPCIDYVLVFSGLAGADTRRLLAATPLLMLAQMVLLPLYLWAFLGAEFVDAVDPGPFVEAFLLLISLPLAAAALTQRAAPGRAAGPVGAAGPVARAAGAVERGAVSAMVPLMVATLALVVASQIAAVSEQLGTLTLVVPVYAVYVAVIVPVGVLAGRLAGLDVPGRRAIAFSGATRNSLVVLPLVLALPAEFEMAPLVVVTQTLVELVAMVLLVRLVPRLVPEVFRIT
ncbi:arsenic resistance protein [Dietzia cinnamea]|uniref:Arsenic resistance protein n=1 Tax=Dietzia cinnamea TaxID=321318 RepID=A0ABV3YLT8_9ACTN|nr:MULTISPECIES: arsenic resistance protein [Dietzia]AVM63120.1 arsenic resistance protein [Dietzia sp. oral taxon 368]MCT1713113.1 arsenic resistance protein [Dietzia cinnamea]MCT2058747.1 arsenic resistance protein [Dietzia cinnamea]MCT2121298.1 arsenic resistance protein [Dietzia cinnamea]MCT2145508.1 arsenic resistance protein [Dietzia cinnamea]